MPIALASIVSLPFPQGVGVGGLMLGPGSLMFFLSGSAKGMPAEN